MSGAQVNSSTVDVFHVSINGPQRLTFSFGALSLSTLFKSRGQDTKKIAAEVRSCHENTPKELRNEPPHDIAGP